MDPVKPLGQRTAVAAATLAAAALIAQQVAGKATRDALFLSSFHVTSLPLVMIASALVSLGAVFAFSAALSRRSPDRVVPATLAFGSVLLLVEWGLALSLPALAAVIVYLHMAAFGATVISGFWSLINERFDPYTARRVMGRIGFGASLGGVAGGLLAWATASVVPAPAMLAVMATFNVVCLFALARLRSTGGSVRGEGGPAEAGSGLFSGLHVVREVPYLRNLALIVALGAATETLLDYLLGARAKAAFPERAALMSFFALFHAGVGLVALAVQASLSKRALRHLGLAGTVALRPAVVGVAGLLGLFDPRLWSALLTRGAHGVLNNSLFRSGYELLFTPLPERRKRPSKAIVDVGFDKLGTLAGSVLLLLLVSRLGEGGPRLLFGLATAGAVLGLIVSRRLHRGYVTALQESLRSGVVRLDLAEVVDSTTLQTLAHTGMLGDREALLREIAALQGEGAPGSGTDRVPQTVADLRSDDAETVRSALRRPEVSDPALAGHLIPLLAKNDLFLDVLQALRRVTPPPTGQLVDALLDPGRDLAVRRRIPRVLRGDQSQRAVDGLVQGLSDARFEVRRRCALALVRVTERAPALLVPPAPIFAAALQELQAGPQAWTDEEPEPVGGEGWPASSEDLAQDPRPPSAAERGLSHVFTLLSLAVERQPLQLAYRALMGDDRSLRGTALEYLANVLPEDVRRGLWAHIGEKAATAPARPREAVVKDLLRAGDTLGLDRDLMKRSPFRR
jgi:ATP:ADP antiporter, AAA family